MRQRMLQKRFFNTNFRLIIKYKKKKYKVPEQNKLNKTACLKKTLYVKDIFQYHVTHDVSVYAIRRRNGEYILPVLIC